MKLSTYLSDVARFTIKIFIIAISFFTIFRLIIFFSQIFKTKIEISFYETLIAFLVGLRFDTVVACYILILPFLILSICSFFKYIPTIISRIVFCYILFLFGITFFICAVDVPYFNYFYSRFSIVAFQWIETPIIALKMVAQEPKYWGALIPFFAVICFFYKLSRNSFGLIYLNSEKNKSRTAFSILILVLLFAGIRGSLSPISPIKVSTAYFCDNSFLNQLGLNPNFTLLRSYIESKKAENKYLKLMNDQEALRLVTKNLGLKNNEFLFARNIEKDKQKVTSKLNIVLIIMESMSAEKTKLGGNLKNLTPFLDSLSTKGYYYKNAYSSGIHTYNGVFSTLFSYPALFKQHPLRDASITTNKSIFTTLKNNNYSTAYFTTHDGYYDNVEGFLRGNDCQKIVTVADYPENEIKTAFGVPDDFMFRFSIPILNNMANKNKPFIATFMTTSDHGPYFIPKYFKPTALEESEQATQYADYSLKKMMQMASKQKWFDNTLFVFVADHGVALDQDYEMPISYNHVPLLFYSPQIIKKPEIISKMALQIDIYPTIMGLLNFPYQNTTLGVDLQQENRPYSFFNGDDKYAVINENWYLIAKEDASAKLFKYRSKDLKDYSKQYPEIASIMHEYAKSNMQSYQYYLKNNGIIKKADLK